MLNANALHQGKDELYEENFNDILDTLELDVPKTYVGMGCGDCVLGLHPVAAWPICRRRIILTRSSLHYGAR